jgi:hypothetical protein
VSPTATKSSAASSAGGRRQPLRADPLSQPRRPQRPRHQNTHYGLVEPLSAEPSGLMDLWRRVISTQGATWWRRGGSLIASMRKHRDRCSCRCRWSSWATGLERRLSCTSWLVVPYGCVSGRVETSGRFLEHREPAWSWNLRPRSGGLVIIARWLPPPDPRRQIIGRRVDALEERVHRHAFSGGVELRPFRWLARSKANP